MFRFRIAFLAIALAVGVAFPASPQTAPQHPAASGQQPSTAGQDAPQQQTPKSATGAAADTAAVPATAAVLTLKNLCPATPTAATPGATRRAACSTVITKADFEKLMNAINPNMPPQARAQVAQGYARILVMATAAEQRNLQKDPNVATLLRLARMRTLAEAMSKTLLAESGKVSDEQIDEYYREHQQRFQEAKLERIFIPKLAGEKQLDAATQKKLADTLHEQAAKGANFAELQKQAYAESGLKQESPPADLGVRRFGSLAPTQNHTVFQLNAGEVSPVLEDASGLYIYKAESRSILPLDSAKAEIRQIVAEQNYRRALREIFEPVQPSLNAQYFGSATLQWNVGDEGEGEEGERERELPRESPRPPKPQKK